VTRHPSPSPIPNGQMVTASALLATNHTPFGASLGETLGQGGPAPAFSDANSEGELLQLVLSLLLRQCNCDFSRPHTNFKQMPILA
jgi:hypothetical protein